MYCCIAILFHFYIIVYLHSLIYVYMDIQEYQHIYIGIVPFRQFSPCTTLLCIPQTWRNCPGRSKASLFSRADGREVEHSLGALRTTPHTYYGCCTLSGLPSESKARSFSQKLNVVHASQREWGLLSASATWSIRPFEKSTASYIFVYIYIAVLAYYCIVVYQYCHITLYIYCLQ